MKEQFLEAWRINNRHNLLLIQHLTDSGLDCTLSKRGGRTVGLQLAHMHNVRVAWIELASKELLKETYAVDKEKKLSRKILSDAFTSSGKAIEKLLDRAWDNEGAVKGFKGGAFRLSAYLISHDSHHRGNILLTLKQCGEKIPDQVKWGLWEW